MAVEYRKEFFDRQYSAREAYGRVWKYARRYKFRIVVGVVCGMLTAGTLLPLFQVIQPTLEKVSRNEKIEAIKAELGVDAAAEDRGSTEKGGKDERRETRDAKGVTRPVSHVSRPSALERQMAEASKLPSWYPKVEKLARKCGIRLQDDDGGMGGALVLIAIFAIPLVALFRLGLVFLNQYCLTWAASHVVADLRVEILGKIERQSMQFFGRIDVGQLMMRAVGDPNTVQQIIQTMLAEVARAPFEIAVSVGFIIWFAIANQMMATLVIIAVGMPAFMLPVIGLGKLIRKLVRRILERCSMVGSRILEILTCIRVVKAYNTERYESVRYAEANRKLLNSTLRAVRMSLMVGPTVETVGILLICAFIVWCFATHVTLANVIPMLAPLLLIYRPIKQLSGLAVHIESAQASLQRIWSLMDLDMELPERADAVGKTSFDGSIRFEDVCFRYETADRDAVSHASFEIPRGKMVAIVGGTGSGKTTMSGLLARFYDPQSGAVRMDGTDLRDLRISDIRRLVGSVQQETILFNDTLEENIKYGSPNATHEEVVAAAKMANAHEFIMSQPEGYARMAGEKGFALSGGERQRIAIARAILRNPPILILDEATSALDTVTEKLVQDALVNLMKNRTVFAIAHRLSTIRNADLILVMDHGGIVERGTHDELYAKNGVYRRLCDMQATN